MYQQRKMKLIPGEKISPIEADAILLSHPDIAQAVAFGVPDEKYGEEVSSFISQHSKAKFHFKSMLYLCFIDNVTSCSTNQLHY